MAATVGPVQAPDVPPPPPRDADREPFTVATGLLTAAVQGAVWSPPELDADQPAPLLVVHDGPAYDREAGLTAYVTSLMREGQVPALRVALLDAPQRDLWYSANRRYATALARDVLPFLRQRRPTTAAIGMGASLGALAWLHAQSSYPRVVDAMFLQSGSFFRPDLDGQESGFHQFPAIVRFVQSVHREGRRTRPVPVTMTCGVDEENLANNRRMARILAALRYPIELHEVPGGHDYPSWRAAFDPHLPALLRAAERPPTRQGTAGARAATGGPSSPPNLPTPASAPLSGRPTS